MEVSSLRNTSVTNVTFESRDGILEILFSCSLTFLLSVMFVVSVTGNTIVIGTMINTWYNTITKTSNHLVFVLAILDLSNSLINLPVAFISSLTGRWIFGDVFCYIQGILYIFLTSCANNILSMISVNRWLLIQKPNIHLRVAKLRTKKMFACCFANGFLIMFIFALPWDSVGFRQGVDIICVPIWGDSVPGMLLMTLVWSLSFYVPLLVMVISYARICRIIKSRVKKVSPGTVYAVCGSVRFVSAAARRAEFTSVAATSGAGEENNNSSTARIQTTCTTERHEDVERKTVTTLLIVIGIFAVCFTPRMVVKFRGALNHGSVPESFQSTAVALSLLNSMLNPLVYSLRSVSFRMAAAEFLAKFKKYT